MFNADKRHYGLGEFEYNLGSGLARRAQELAKEDIHLTFLVDTGCAGLFGRDGVDYMEISKEERKHPKGNILPPRTDLTSCI